MSKNIYFQGIPLLAINIFMDKQTDLTQGDIREHLKQLAIPSSVAFFFGTMLYIVDTYFAGAISTKAQAALSLGFPIYFIIIAFIQGISVGAQTVIANTLGEGKPHRAVFLSCQALVFGASVAIFLSIFGYFFSAKLLKLLGAKGEVLEHSASYVEAIFLVAVFLIVTNTMSAILMSYGFAKPFRNWVILAFLMHLVGDYWLIYGGLGVPPLGFDGIVITTIITMITGSFFMGVALWETGLLKESSIRDFIPDRDSFRELANQGFPACMNMISVAFGLLLIMGFILYFGESAAAAYGIGIRIQQIFLLPTLGISIAVLAIIGQNNGAGRIDRVQETLKQSFYFGFIVLSLGFALMMGAPEFLYRLFTTDTEVIEMGTIFLRISSVTGFAFMAITFYTAALQGMKYPFSAFTIGFGRQVLLPVIVLPVLFTWFHITLVSIWIMILGVNAAFACIAYLLTQRALRKRLDELGPDQKLK